MAKQKQQKSNKFHWKQLRRVIVTQYPDRISNKKLHEQFKCKPITTEIAKWRLQKFAHILKLNENVPTNEVIIYYFTHSMKQSFRGKHRTKLVTQLNKDINLVKMKYPEVNKKFRLIRRHSNVLECVNDLQSFRQLERNKMLWKSIADYVYCAVKAELPN